MCAGQIFPPGHTEHIGQVEREVDEASAGCCQIGTREERADEEAQHDCGCSKGDQEEEDHCRVAVGQDIAQLKGRKQSIHSIYFFIRDTTTMLECSTCSTGA